MTMQDAPRIVIVGDNLLARAGLAALLAPVCDVVGQTAAGATIADDMEVFQPDAILVDLGWTPEKLLAQLIPLSDSDVPLVALLTDDNAAVEVLAWLAQFPVFGLLRQNTPPQRIVAALNAVLDGLIILDPTLAKLTLPSATQSTEFPTETLTKRELEVLQLLATGQTNKSIARKLGITDHTVKFHVNAIMTKLGAQSRTDAVVRATRAGVLFL
jgi:DNA-binding NarL/FixJ family response regulator